MFRAIFSLIIRSILTVFTASGITDVCHGRLVSWVSWNSNSMRCALCSVEHCPLSTVRPVHTQHCVHWAYHKQWTVSDWSTMNHKPLREHLKWSRIRRTYHNTDVHSLFPGPADVHRDIWDNVLDYIFGFEMAVHLSNSTHVRSEVLRKVNNNNNNNITVIWNVVPCSRHTRGRTRWRWHNPPQLW